MQRHYFLPWIVSLVLGRCLISLPAQAQLAGDGTLGGEESVVTPNVLIKGELGDRIDGGAIRGSNLFHSFSQFNIQEGQRVYFANPMGIEKIFGRVTGNTLSSILGTLGVEGNANLFLLNPNGILFGANARLDISGSFLASTANRFTFPNELEFSAINPQSAPLLSISVTPGLQYGAGQPVGTISNRGNLIAEKDLTLAAGDLDLQGQLQGGQDLTLQAQSIVKIRDAVTTPFLAQSGRDLTIQGNQGIDILALNHSQIPIRSGGNLRLISDGTISGDAHFASAGDFSILNLAGNLGTFVSLYDPIIRANGDVIFGNYTGVALKVEATGSINGGDIRITGSDIAIPATDPDFALLSTSPSVILRAGLTSISASNLPQIGVGNPPTNFTTGTSSPRQSRGSIIVGNIDTSNQIDEIGDAGDGGAIILKATGNIQTGNLNSRSLTNTGNSGNGGAITLSTSRGDISTGDVRSYSFSDSGGNSENGGAITVTALGGNISTGDVILSYSFSGSGNSGDGGAITFITTEGNISAGVLGGLSSVSESPFSSGNGGDITLTTTRGSIVTRDLFSDTSAGSSDSGNGGNITLTANGGNIRTEELSTGSGSDSGNSGNGGNITLTANGGSIRTEELSAGSGSDSGNSGNGGNITLTANGGSIETDDLFSKSSSVSGNSGNGSNVSFTAVGGDIRFGSGFRESSVGSSSGTGNSGNGGNVTFTAIGGSIFSNSWLESSSISGDFFASRSGNSGSGGNITFTATEGSIVTDRLYSLSASRFGNSGDGGAITLVASQGKILTDALNSSSALYFGDRGNSIKPGNGGAITLTAISDIQINELIFGSSINPSNEFRGGGNPLIMDTAGNISIGQLLPNGASTVIGNNIPPRTTVFPSVLTAGGNFSLTTSSSITLRNTDIITSQPNGNSGNITIQTPEIFLLDQSRLFTSIEPGTAGTVGTITVNAGSVFLTNSALIDTATFATGNAGKVNITARDSISLNQSDVVSRTSSTGSGGQIFLQAGGTVSLANRSTVSTATTSQSTGNGGNIVVNAGILSIAEGSQFQAFTQGTGNSGNIAITAGDITISEIGVDGILSGVFTSADAANSGKGGNIIVTTPGILRILDGGVLSSQTSSAAEGGTIFVQAGTVELTNGGQLLASTVGSGPAGNIKIDATNTVVIDGSNLTPRTSQELIFSCIVAEQICGTDFNPNIEFSTRIPHASLRGLWVDGVDEYSITVAVPGTLAIFDIDNGGYADLDSSGQIVNNGLSGIDTTLSIVNSQGVILASNDNASTSLGAGGSFRDRQSTENGGREALSSRDSYLRYIFAEPGTYTIQVSKKAGIFERIRQYTLQVSLAPPAATGSVVDTSPNSGLFARTQDAGTAGSIVVTTPQLNVLNGGQVSVSTASLTSSGTGGSIILNTSQIDLASNSRIFSGTEGVASGGSIMIQPYFGTPSLNINFRDGAQISASTSGVGLGGSLTLTAPESIILQGNGTAIAGTVGSGKGGNLQLTTHQLTIRDGAQVSASSEGIGVGGNLEIIANKVLIDNKGKLIAETQSSDGGNINIIAKDLLFLRRNALISATAGTAQTGGDGGNIRINAGFIVAVPNENSDITANAFTGRGGRVSITAQGIYGTAFRPRLTPLSDITASSDFGTQGDVTFNLPTIDASRGLTTLPTLPVDATKLISQNPCTIRPSQSSQFIITGRGGLPDSPNDPQSSETFWEDLRLLAVTEPVQQHLPAHSTPATAPDTIIEAQSWIRDAQGSIHLVAANSSPSPVFNAQPQCHSETPSSTQP